MSAENTKPKVLFISSGATVTGVPIYFINLLNWIKSNTNIDITILTAFDGPLENEYIKLAPAYRWDVADEPAMASKSYLIRLLQRITKKIFRIHRISHQEKILAVLKTKQFDLIYVNSVASLWIFEQIREHLQAKVILHVHELQLSILQFCGDEMLLRNIRYCNRLIVISKAVEQNLKEKYGIPEEMMTPVYTFVDNKKAENIDISRQRRTIRDMLGIPQDAIIVASSGTTDWRKGADLVVHIAQKVYSKNTFPIYFIWIGGDNSGLEFQKLYYDLIKLNLQNKIHFLGSKEKPLEYFAAADVFMLCSREEPVGIVALEAASLGKPILCFDKAGGMPEFVGNECGFIIPYLDIDAMADHIILLQNDRSLLHNLGAHAADKVKHHDINIACREIETIMNSVMKS